MRCEDFRERLDEWWEVDASAEARGHLAQCSDCAARFRDLRLLRAGMRLWRQEAAPEPTLGFADRLVRQLGELAQAPGFTDFFERAGKRFVYAALVLTFVAILAMALPATGPVRGLNVADIQPSVQESLLAYSDPIGEAGSPEVPEAPPVDVSGAGSTKGVK